MIQTADVKALRKVEDDLVALVLPKAKVEQLHTIIGKTRYIISTLPDKDVVLRVDFEAHIISQNGDEYVTHLKIGRLRTRIDAEKMDSLGNIQQAVHFWPMWNDEEVEFESLGPEEIENFVQNENKKQDN